MSRKLDLKIENSFEQLAVACRKIHDFLVELTLAHSLIYAIDLAAEEMATNIIKYGYDDDKSHEISITLQFDSEQRKIILLLEDDGHEFDPLQAEQVDFSSDISKRKIGGMGIHLTKSLVDFISYNRQNDRNILRIEMEIKE